MQLMNQSINRPHLDIYHNFSTVSLLVVTPTILSIRFPSTVSLLVVTPTILSIRFPPHPSSSLDEVKPVLPRSIATRVYIGSRHYCTAPTLRPAGLTLHDRISTR